MLYPYEFNADYLIKKLRLYPKYCTEEEMRQALDTFIDTIKTRYVEGRTDWLPGPEIIIECPGPFSQTVISDTLRYISRDITQHEAADPVDIQYIRQHEKQHTFKNNAILEVQIKANSRLFTETGVSDIIRIHATQGADNRWTPIITTIGDKCTYGMQKSWRFIRLGSHRAKDSDVDDWSE